VGFSSGLFTTALSVLLFVAVAIVVGDDGASFDLQRFLVRLVYLFVLGYLMAHWEVRRSR
jgi:uncharacterized membrane protein YqjE